MIPIAGSAYTYGYATLGEFVAWIIGWDLILEYLFAASTVAVGWSGYVVSFLKDVGINIPAQYTSAPYTHSAPPDAGINVWRLFTEGWSSTGAVLNVPAMIIVALITILLIVGIQESASFNNVIVVIKLTVVFLFIGFGLAYVNQENWEPFVPPAAGPGQVRLERHRPRRGRDLLRLHRLRRGLDRRAGDARTRSATCRSASSARSPSARCSTSWWRWC